MHSNINEIKKLEGSPKVIKNLFDKMKFKNFSTFIKNYRLQFIIKNKM